VLSCPPGTTFTTEGRNQSVSGTGSDYALNKTTATITVNIDWTPPTVGYSGNAGSYTIDQTVDITCFATDALSGVATSTCMPIIGPAYTFVIGANSYSFTATDFADNSASASTAFNVIVTAPSLCHLTEMFSDDAGAANGLCAKIYAVASAPNAIDKEGKLLAFDNQVNAQTGNALTSDQASILKRLIPYL
jgi:hypothetical protein